MRKILFCAGLLALAASCAETDLDTIGQSGLEKSNGITFQAVENEGPTTKGGFEPNGSSYIPFWYAEDDRIAVFGTYYDVKAGSGKENDNNTFDATKYVEYKATQSATKGWFTGINDDNTMVFKDDSEDAIDKRSQFVAVYPKTLASGVTAAAFADDKFTFGNLPALAAQNQKDLDGAGIYENMIKYSVSKETWKSKSYDAVGEKLDLDFKRPLPGLIFNTKNAEGYLAGKNSAFGNLKKITVTMLGEKADGTDQANASKITLNDDAALVVDVTTGQGEINPGVGGQAASEIELTINSTTGLPWSDDAVAFMVIAPIKRTKTEYFTVEYDFDNISFTKTYSTDKSWKEGFYGPITLDASQETYLVTNETSGSAKDRTLIINSGNLNGILNTTKDKVKWGGAEIALTEFAEVICNVELTDEEIKILNGYTGLKKITLAKNTTIPAEAFTALTGLESIDMPMVETIAEDAFANNMASLKSLKLKSYPFNVTAVNDKLLKKTLVTLDMSSIAKMAGGFGEASISFEGYTVLEEVTLKDGIKLSPNAFKGCTALATVNGIVELNTGAFEGCGALTTINISGAAIPANAFKDCTVLESVLYNKAAVVPTSVGASAFESAKAIEYMDLSQVTSLGASAFSASGLISPSVTNKILTVGAAHIPASAFASTAVEMVNFTNATSFGVNIFNQCTSLSQVKFDKAFEIQEADMPIASNGWETTFGTATNVSLFVAAGQNYVSANNLTLPYKNNGTVTNATPIAFAAISE